MTHDPLCGCTPKGCKDCALCECQLITRVREDERQKTFDADWSEMGQLAAIRIFRQQARRDALRDAVDVVKALPPAETATEGFGRADALAAIEALQ